MGYDQILIKLFPKYRDDENGHNGFLAFGIFLSLFGILLSSILFYFFGESIIKKDDLELFRRFSILIFPLIFFRIIFYNLDGYVRMLYNTTIGVFLERFLSKVVIGACLILFGLAWISFDNLVYLYALAFCLPGIIIVVFSFYKTNKLVLPNPEIYQKSNRKKLYEYITFGLLMGASGSIVVYIDGFMITKMLSLEALGYYSIFFFAARFIIIPAQGIGRISMTILAEAWEKNDRKTIADVYQKSCVNQLLIGAFLLGLGWTLLTPALELHLKLADYAPHKIVFLILGTGLVIEMATGVNSVIIAATEKYKFNTYFNIALAAVLIVLNYFFITAYDLIGAAVASALGMTFINLLRWYFLVKNYQLQPFGKDFFKALALSLTFVVGCYFLHYQGNPILRILINTCVLTLLFWGIVVAFKLSPDVNTWLLKMKKKSYK